MAKRTKVPRASLAVTIPEDPDYVALMADHGGRAWGLFCALVIQARKLGNGGEFREPVEVIAWMIHWPVDDLRADLEQIARACRLNQNEPWILVENGRLIVRSFRTWNSRGGARPGAGRNSKGIQTAIKPGIKLNSKGSMPVPVPVSAPDAAHPPPPPPTPSACTAPTATTANGTGGGGGVAARLVGFGVSPGKANRLATLPAAQDPATLNRAMAQAGGGKSPQGLLAHLLEHPGEIQGDQDTAKSRANERRRAAALDQQIAARAEEARRARAELATPAEIAEELARSGLKSIAPEATT